jgi:tryptophan synthase alpha chain
MASRRIQETFEQLRAQRKTGIIPFVTVGFPDVETTLDLVAALVDAGADVIELGVPFSDPLADGATIQKAGHHALQNGVSLRRCLEVCATLRHRGIETPLVLMGYYNPLLALGIEEFVDRAQEAGVDGLIVVDLPPEESGPLREAAIVRGIDVISLLTPTSTEQRVAAACATASGFVYCVSVAGVTGARAQVSREGLRLVQTVRRHTELPIAMGFGLSSREHVEAVGEYADAAVVGSALVDVIDRAPAGTAAAEAGRFIAGLQVQHEALGSGAK